MKIEVVLKAFLFTLLSPLTRSSSDSSDTCNRICVCKSTKGKIESTSSTITESILSYRSNTITEEAVCKSIPESISPNIKSLMVRADLRNISKDLIGIFSTLKILNLSGCNISSIEEDAFGKLQELEVLRLSNNKIQDISHLILQSMSKLKELHLDNNTLKVIDDDAFSSLKSLKVLNLSKNDLFDIPLSLPQGLLVLDVSSNQIKQTVLKVINLTRLDMCGNPLLSAPDLVYKQFQLESLCLGDSLQHMSSCHFKNEMGLRCQLVWPKIRELTLSARDAEQAIFTIDMQKTISKHTLLSKLQLENYKLDSIKFLSNLSKLTHLRLKNVQTTRLPEVDDIIRQTPLLESLDLDSSPQLAMAFLESKIGYSRLHKLSLRNTDIKLITYSENRESILKNILEIDLRDNPLDCSSNEWGWLLPRMHKNNDILINANEVKCHSEVKPFIDFIKNLSAMGNKDKVQDSTTMPTTQAYEELKADAQISSVTCGSSKGLMNVLYTFLGVVVALGVLGVLKCTIIRFKKRTNNKQKTRSHQEWVEVPLQG